MSWAGLGVAWAGLRLALVGLDWGGFLCVALGCVGHQLCLDIGKTHREIAACALSPRARGNEV